MEVNITKIQCLHAHNVQRITNAVFFKGRRPHEQHKDQRVKEGDKRGDEV